MRADESKPEECKDNRVHQQEPAEICAFATLDGTVCQICLKRGAHQVRMDVPEEVVVIAPPDGVVHERTIMIELLDDSLEFFAIFCA